LSNLLNINYKTSPNIPNTSNTYIQSRESTPININSYLTENPIALSLNQQVQSKGVALDSACTHSSYRVSDVPNISNISQIHPNAQLDLTTANGGHVYSKGITSREFPLNIKTPIHVFKDEDLHLSMHALNSFTNHPVNGTVVLDKHCFKAYDSNGILFCTHPKDENDKMWFLPPAIPDTPDKQISETSKGEEPHSILGQGNFYSISFFRFLLWCPVSPRVAP
jgi:hypothetical protein